RVRERVRIEPRQRDKHDSDAKEDDYPPECAWCAEEPFERFVDQSRVARSTAAISSTRVRRERRSRHSGESSTSGSPPPRQRPWSSASAARIAVGSSGDATTPASVARISSAAAPSGGTAARI